MPTSGPNSSGECFDNARRRLDDAWRRITRLNNGLRRMPHTDERYEALAAGLLAAIEFHTESRRHIETTLRAISLAQDELISCFEKLSELEAANPYKE